MAGIAIIISALAGLIAIVFAGVAVFFWAFAVEEVKQENDYSLTPFEPEFNEDDDDTCQELINGFYNDAVSAFLNAETTEETMAESYQDILESLDTNGISLVDNAAFRSWVLSDYVVIDDEPVPVFDGPMEATFGAGAALIETPTQLQDALYTLVFFREQFGLEQPIYADEPYFPYDSFEVCSIETVFVGHVYAQYLVTYCCDLREDNLGPIIARLNDWIASQSSA